jgi:predicted acyltransferase (DUF342 family)
MALFSYMASSRKAIVFICAILLTGFYSYAQNVGIGTNNPTRKLSVSGAIVVDHDSASNGTLDNASLLFGSGATAGISSNKNAVAPNFRGIDLWTNSLKRFSISNNGNVGIGTDIPGYKLHVNGSLYTQNNVFVNQSAFISGTLQVDEHVAIAGSVNNDYSLYIGSGNNRFNGKLFVGGTPIGSEQLHVSTAGGTSARFSGGNVIIDEGATVSGNLFGQTIQSGSTLRVNDYAAIGGNLDNNYKLRVYDGNARIGGEFHATGNSAIGGEVDNNYRLRVYNGNSRFGGDVQVTGTLNTTDFSVANNFTINGKGSVRSEGPSPLRIGFQELTFNNWNDFNANESKSYIISLPDFANAADIRVLFNHYIPSEDAAFQHYNRFRFMITHINPAGNSCTLRIFNDSGAASTLIGTISMMTVMKDN